MSLLSLSTLPYIQRTIQTTHALVLCDVIFRKDYFRGRCSEFYEFLFSYPQTAVAAYLATQYFESKFAVPIALAFAAAPLALKTFKHFTSDQTTCRRLEISERLIHLAAKAFIALVAFELSGESLLNGSLVKSPSFAINLWSCSIDLCRLSYVT